MKRTLPVLLLLLPFVATPQSADEILDKYVQALGGKAAIEKITSRVMKGAVEDLDDSSTGTAEVSSKAPNFYLSSFSLSDGEFRDALNGSAGWSQNPDAGIRDTTGADMAAAKRDYDFYRDVKIKELYPKRSVTGTANVGSREATVVEIAPASGRTEKLYFDTKTGLLLKREYERVSLEEGIATVEMYYEDYRDVDGVKVPFAFRTTAYGDSLAFKFTEVRHNVPVEDAKFQKPAK